jgi:hypothetical protein
VHVEGPENLPDLRHRTTAASASIAKRWTELEHRLSVRRAVNDAPALHSSLSFVSTSIMLPNSSALLGQPISFRITGFLDFFHRPVF